MRNIIICEGSTDYALLQYFMRTAYGWEDSKVAILGNDSHFAMKRTLQKNGNTLTIAGAGGCSKIPSCVERVLEVNNISQSTEESFQKIVIIIDRDEVGTEEAFIEKLNACLDSQSVQIVEDIENDKWIKGHYRNSRGKKIEFLLLLLVIPFETTGALETFLLEAIAQKDVYDANIIAQCNSFIDNIDPQERYLNKRRYKTKAKFDVFFSVRTAVSQFVERQNILKNIDWENYFEVQESFKKLEELSISYEY